MKRKITTIILFAYLALKVSAQNFSELEKTVQAELLEKNAVGAGAAIIKNDRVIFAKGFGAANVETNAPITPDTLFQIGSMTKTLTAAMIHSFVEEGKLKLDQPIGAYAKNLSPKLLYPAGTMYSSLNDMTRFAIAFLKQGKMTESK